MEAKIENQEWKETQVKTKRKNKKDVKAKKPMVKNRMIVVKDGVVGPRRPVGRTVRQRTPGDYAVIPKAYLDVAKLYSSPLLMGPPLCDELMALIQHMFTEEEASIVRHFRPFQRKNAAQIASKAHRPAKEVRDILERLARNKFILLSMGELSNRRYAVLPIVPGTFEMVLTTTSMEKLTGWQREFARRFEELHETGFITDYLQHKKPGVRYLPLGQSIEFNQMALPSDKLEEVFDRYDKFGVTQCQCRMTEIIAGRGCARELENCVVFGDAFLKLVEYDKVRVIDKKEAVAIKREAEASGLVSWMINEESGRYSNCSCSCCGCCCHMMRTVTEFNLPAMIAPPHFRPAFDLSQCDRCTMCALRCPMGAITVDTKTKTHVYNPKRCVGCGQCVVACDKKHAVRMDAVADYKLPPADYKSLLLKMTPNALRTALKVWLSRI